MATSEIAQLLINAGADIHYQSSYGTTYLMITGRLETIKVLLENGADTNIKDNEGKTALIYAVKDKYNLEKVKLLIKYGAGINIRDNNGNTALSIAKEFSNTKIVKLLIEARAKD